MEWTDKNIVTDGKTPWLCVIKAIGFSVWSRSEAEQVEEYQRDLLSYHQNTEAVLIMKENHW